MFYHVSVEYAYEHWMNRYNDIRNFQLDIRMALNLNGYFCDSKRNFREILD